MGNARRVEKGGWLYGKHKEVDKRSMTVWETREEELREKS